MTTAHSDDAPGDAMSHFAASCRLWLNAEPIYYAPYDAVEPPSEAERAYLVNLTVGDPPSTRAMRLVFLVSPTPRKGGLHSSEARPNVRDVLWWLAADAWAVEHARRDPVVWAAHHGFDSKEPATQLQFDQRLRQASELSALLGDTNYGRLLDVYADMSGQHGKKSDAPS